MAGFQPVTLAHNKYEPIGGVDETLAPVVFCHCIGAAKENWGDIPQNVANATKRRAYTIDARNHGDTEWSETFNFDIIADDLIHFLETTEIAKAILVGHSMGGIMIIRTALKAPEKVEKLVVEDMFVKKVPEPMLKAVISYFNIARKGLKAAPADLTDEDGMKKFVMDYIHANLPQEAQDLSRGEKQPEASHLADFKRSEDGRLVFRSNLEVIENAMRDSETIMSDPQGLYEGPACFIYGKHSPFKLNEEDEHIKQFFPNAVFEGIEDATHTVHVDCPIEFTDTLLKFIS